MLEEQPDQLYVALLLVQNICYGNLKVDVRFGCC